MHLPLPTQRRWRLFLVAGLAVATLFILHFSQRRRIAAHFIEAPEEDTVNDTVNVTSYAASIELAQHFAANPLRSPYRDAFGELGRRCRILRDWLDEVDRLPRTRKSPALVDAIEQTALSLFPFLPLSSAQSGSIQPLSHLRASFEVKSVGIVIPCGEKTFRFAAHLILSLRQVLHSKLEIQIAYAGDSDLSPESRRELLSVLGSASWAVEFMDVTEVFDDSWLALAGSWAIKSFAALGSRFERVILMDADAVFLQTPEVLFSHPGFVAEGALLFHDRLLWQHVFKDRHKWFHSQISDPSDTLKKSRVWSEEYAEEQDAGVVVVDKSRTGVLVGLLHTCWQNTKAVREEVTYKMTYGDKESWWLGLELAGSSYQFEKHYGAIVGWEEDDGEGEAKVCSFVIAHLDDEERLLWYNGGLLKNKMTSNEYSVPEKWMVDGEWIKGARKESMSCMAGAEARNLTEDERSTVGQSIMKARAVDEFLGYAAN